MRRRFPHFIAKHVLLGNMLLACILSITWFPASAQEKLVFEKSITFTPALIPLRVNDALEAWQAMARTMGINRAWSESTLPRKVRFYGIGSSPTYTLELEPHLSFDFKPFTGDIEIRDWRKVRDIAPEDVLKESKAWLPEAQLTNAAVAAKDKFYPRPELLNQPEFNWQIRIMPNRGFYNAKTETFTQLVGYANRGLAVFRQFTPERVRTLNRCMIGVLRENGQVVEVNKIYRPELMSLLPAYTRSEALAIARWLVADGHKMPTPLKLAYQLNSDQRMFLGDGYDFSEPYLEVQEDAWLCQRLAWAFQFEFTSISLDANTGQPTSEFFPARRELSKQEQELFGLPQPVDIPKPTKIPSRATKVETSGVNFNGELIESPREDPNAQQGSSALHSLYYPPIIRDNAVLIFSEYFSKFLIAVERKGDAITLKGQLKDKGKSATLKIGAKQATVDGKEVTLASAPVVIDNRLYLPAELLQLTNGIPVRWEPKNKLLWVETRYLRR